MRMAASLRGIDLVEGAAVAEVLGLRLGPAAEILDRHQMQRLEARGILGRGLRAVPGAVEVLERQRLRLGAVEVFEIGIGQRALRVGLDVGIDHRNRRLGEDRDRGHDDVESIGAKLLFGQPGLVLPGEQHIADAALRKGRGRAARAGVEHRDMAEEIADEGLRVLSVLLGPGPGGQVVPARPARGLRIGGDDLDAVLHQIAPVVDALRIALAHQEDDGRGIGRGIVRQPPLPVGRQLAGRGDLVDVGGKREGHDLRVEPVDHRPGLRPRAAVRDLDLRRLVALRDPPVGEQLVVIAVEFAGRIVADVEQRLGGLRGLRRHGKGRERQRQRRHRGARRPHQVHRKSGEDLAAGGDGDAPVGMRLDELALCAEAAGELDRSEHASLLSCRAPCPFTLITTEIVVICNGKNSPYFIVILENDSPAQDVATGRSAARSFTSVQEDAGSARRQRLRQDLLRHRRGVQHVLERERFDQHEIGPVELGEDAPDPAAVLVGTVVAALVGLARQAGQGRDRPVDHPQQIRDRHLRRFLDQRIAARPATGRGDIAGVAQLKQDVLEKALRRTGARRDLLDAQRLALGGLLVAQHHQRLQRIFHLLRNHVP
ncbi:hypothetical protein SDC9_13035 [bioreactor metagenome]|uniref:Uncharacterized protein n=1 Tax=bioreactor metagenome TaxID=1076179 RepID=A0A644TKA4_9ZZZZ